MHRGDGVGPLGDILGCECHAHMSPAACLEHSARSLETERLEQRHNVRDLRHMHCQGGDGDAQLLDFLDDVLFGKASYMRK